MPKFDRSILARFLPNPRAISDFEKLNTAVDVELPASIDENNALASQANVAAQQALVRIDNLTGRLDAAELNPVSAHQQLADDLTPANAALGPADSLAPAPFSI